MRKDKRKNIEKCARHFIRWASQKLPKGTRYHLSYNDEEKPYYYLGVSVPLLKMNFVEAEYMVLKLAKKYGLLKRFEQSGAGCGLGYRDVGFINK